MASNYLTLKKCKRTDMAFDELFADHFIKPNSGVKKNRSSDVSLDTYHYMPLMVRLYEQAKELSRSDIENKCLDIWDGMFEMRIESIHEISKVID